MAISFQNQSGYFLLFLSVKLTAAEQWQKIQSNLLTATDVYK